MLRTFLNLLERFKSKKYALLTTRFSIFDDASQNRLVICDQMSFTWKILTPLCLYLHIYMDTFTYDPDI